MIVTVEPDHAPPRVRIDTTAPDVFRVAGDVRTQVRGGVVGGVAYDYECPQETPVTYDDLLVVSDPVELPNVGDWLVHLGAPDLSCEVVLREHPGWSQPATGDVVDIPGGPTVAVTFPRTADRGSFAVTTYTSDEETALRVLLADGSVLWLSTHAEVGLGPCYVALGDARWDRRQNWSGDPSRIVTLPYVEVDRPVFVVSSGSTWDDEVGTWAAAVGDWSA